MDRDARDDGCRSVPAQTTFQSENNFLQIGYGGRPDPPRSTHCMSFPSCERRFQP